MSLNFKNERLLVIAPHADDEVLGCFELIERVKKNDGQVFLQILTLGGYSKLGKGSVKKSTWKNELLDVVKELKIDDYSIAYYSNKLKYLDTIPQQELITLLESKSKLSIIKIKPTIVAIPTIFSTHQDHISTYQTAITALRSHPEKINGAPNLIVSYESPEYYYWSSYSEFGKFSPNFYLKLTKNDLTKKIKVLNLYKSQLRKDQRDGEKIEALARMRGSEISEKYAEAYHIHRFHI